MGTTRGLLPLLLTLLAGGGAFAQRIGAVTSHGAPNRQPTHQAFAPAMPNTAPTRGPIAYAPGACFTTPAPAAGRLGSRYVPNSGGRVSAWSGRVAHGRGVLVAPPPAGAGRCADPGGVFLSPRSAFWDYAYPQAVQRGEPWASSWWLFDDGYWSGTSRARTQPLFEDAPARPASTPRFTEDPDERPAGAAAPVPWWRRSAWVPGASGESLLRRRRFAAARVYFAGNGGFRNKENHG